jgi:hypothetical protein
VVVEIVLWVLAILTSLALLFGGAAFVAIWHPDPARRADALRVMDRVTALVRALLRMR